MTIPIVTALHAAETLAAFHRQQAADSLDSTREYHVELGRRCAEDAEHSRRAILASGVTVNHQAEEVRRYDMEVAQRILDRHVIMYGMGLPDDEVPAARMAMARDIADALQEARGEMRS